MYKLFIVFMKKCNSEHPYIRNFNIYATWAYSELRYASISKQYDLSILPFCFIRCVILPTSSLVQGVFYLQLHCQFSF